MTSYGRETCMPPTRDFSVEIHSTGSAVPRWSSFWRLKGRLAQVASSIGYHTPKLNTSAWPHWWPFLYPLSPSDFQYPINLFGGSLAAILRAHKELTQSSCCGLEDWVCFILTFSGQGTLVLYLFTYKGRAAMKGKYAVSNLACVHNTYFYTHFLWLLFHFNDWNTWPLFL